MGLPGLAWPSLSCLCRGLAGECSACEPNRLQVFVGEGARQRDRGVQEDQRERCPGGAVQAQVDELADALGDAVENRDEVGRRLVVQQYRL